LITSDSEEEKDEGTEPRRSKRNRQEKNSAPKKNELLGRRVLEYMIPKEDNPEGRSAPFFGRIIEYDRKDRNPTFRINYPRQFNSISEKEEAEDNRWCNTYAARSRAKAYHDAEQEGVLPTWQAKIKYPEIVTGGEVNLIEDLRMHDACSPRAGIPKVRKENI